MSYSDILPGMESTLTPADYESLAEFRYQIRRFLSFSEQAARDVGLEPRQHQLLLALKGLPAGSAPAHRRVGGEVADSTSQRGRIGEPPGRCRFCTQTAQRR